MRGSDARAWWLGGLISLVSLVVVLVTAAPASAVTYANFTRSTYSYSSLLSPAQEASRYQVLTLQSTDAAMVPILKAANPGLRILMYEGIAAADDTPGAAVTCTAGPWVLANHPNWILNDQNGQHILYQNHYLTDVGNPSYQQTCLTNAVALAKRDRFDGVFWDMVNTKLTWTLPPGKVVPQYSTDPSWQAAMYSMLAYAGPTLHAAGLLSIANIGGAGAPGGLWQQWNGPMDGAEEESWTDGKVGLAQQIPNWPFKLANVAWSEAHHKIVLLHSWNTTQAGNVYGLAAMMLAADGESSYSTSNGCYTSCEVWYPEYTAAQQLGAPMGPYTVLPNGVNERLFQNGIVVVNPTARSIPVFSLGGGSYTGSGLVHTSAVGMGPTSGYVLLADGTFVATPPAISGSAAVGRTLTAIPAGSWPSGSRYSFQWERCTEPNPTTCAAIDHANAATYTVRAADIYHYLAVVETVSTARGIATATSAETAMVPRPIISRVASPHRPSSSRTGLRLVFRHGRFVLLGQIDPHRLWISVTCPRKLRRRCRVAVSLWSARSTLARKAGKRSSVLVARGTLVIGPGHSARLNLVLTAAGRRLLASGRQRRVRIRVRAQAGRRLATLTRVVRIGAPTG